MAPKNRFITCEICGDRASRTNREKRMFMAKFPLDEARCKQWVKVVGKEDLIYVPIEKLHTLKYVCGNHFKDRDFNKNKNRLRKTAVPSKNLKAAPLPDEMLFEFPCYIASNIDVTKYYVPQRMRDKNYKGPCLVVEAVAGRRNSGVFSSLGLDVQLEHNYSFARTNPQKEPAVEATPVEVSNEDTSTNDEDVKSGITEFEETPMEAIFSWQKDELIHSTEDTEVPMCPGEDRREGLRQALGDVSLYDEPAAEGDRDSDKHAEYRCNVCQKAIKGFRYTCVQCADWDLCGACEARGEHAEHYVLRVPSPRPYNEVQAVLAAIRQQLLSDNLFLSEQITEDSLKVEAKEEPHGAEEEECHGAEAEEPAPEPDPLRPRPASEDEHSDGSEYRPSRRKSSDTSDTSQDGSLPDSDTRDAQHPKLDRLLKTANGYDNLVSNERIPSERLHHGIDHSRRKSFTRSASTHIEIDTDLTKVLHSTRHQLFTRQSTDQKTFLEYPATIYEVPANTMRYRILDVPDNVTVLKQDTPHTSDSFDINPIDTRKEVDGRSNIEDDREILHMDST